MSFPKKISTEYEGRIEELHALGCSDSEISRLMQRKVTSAGVRCVRKRLKLLINYQVPTKFTGKCSACGAECGDKPLCFECWKGLHVCKQRRIATVARFQPRVAVERMAKYAVEMTTATEETA